MRVIAGTAKRLQLKTLDGMETRPTTDRIKETLFNMIAPSVFGSVFLDLFAGSGGIGIEALSRGEKVFDFVFMDPPYDQDLERQVLTYLSGSELIYEDTVIIVEASKHTDFSYLEDLGFTLIKEKEYKTNKHVFIEKAGKEMIC